mmetsp:Transcript_26758/g.54757  ORF Transcript_26758/g.54757 Transcript_26758/m.54757 type:complete len:211 (+) Transcript_26758:1214-1846(+)
MSVPVTPSDPHLHSPRSAPLVAHPPFSHPEIQRCFAKTDSASSPASSSSLGWRDATAAAVKSNAHEKFLASAAARTARGGDVMAAKTRAFGILATTSKAEIDSPARTPPLPRSSSSGSWTMSLGEVMPFAVAHSAQPSSILPTLLFVERRRGDRDREWCLALLGANERAADAKSVDIAVIVPFKRIVLLTSTRARLWPGDDLLFGFSPSR